jgi:hypothetical protein|tara:strand:- start:1187 stop:1474 length:288 start_codon:yes stop_codon:yes gene_type:complete
MLISTKEDFIELLKHSTVVRWKAVGEDNLFYQPFLDNEVASKFYNQLKLSKEIVPMGLLHYGSLSDDDAIWEIAKQDLREAYNNRIDNKKIFKFH